MGDGIPAKKDISNIFVNSVLFLISRYTIEPILFLTYSICPVLLQHKPSSLYFLCSLFFLIYLHSTKIFFAVACLVTYTCYNMDCDSYSKFNVSSVRMSVVFNKHVTRAKECKMAFRQTADIVTLLSSIKCKLKAIQICRAA